MSRRSSRSCISRRRTELRSRSSHWRSCWTRLLPAHRNLSINLLKRSHLLLLSLFTAARAQPQLTAPRAVLARASGRARAPLDHREGHPPWLDSVPMQGIHYVALFHYTLHHGPRLPRKGEQHYGMRPLSPFQYSRGKFVFQHRYNGIIIAMIAMLRLPCIKKAHQVEHDQHSSFDIPYTKRFGGFWYHDNSETGPFLFFFTLLFFQAA